MIYSCIKIFVTIWISTFFCSGLNNGIAKTSSGPVRGKLMKTFNNSVEYYAFLKVPFAKPPVKERRFKAPESYGKWNGVYDASKEPDQCTQASDDGKIVGSEDCLYLRIYTPKKNKLHPELLPVMYFVHGGAFVSGAPNFDVYGPDLFMEKDVVLALVQYRLGFYGFFSTEDESCPGNNGLKDQRLGLRWIKENAKSFGGDPDKITIFGHSAGSASIGYLVDTPTTAGLFRAAIMQSASEIGSFARQYGARKKAFTIGRHFGINTNNSRDLIEKLRSIDYKKLEEAATKISTEINQEYGIFVVSFCPLIEAEHKDAILTEKPLQQLQRAGINKVPMITGFTSLEATTMMDLIPPVLKKYRADITSLVPNTIVTKDNQTKYLVAKQIQEHYFAKQNIDYAALRYASDNLLVRNVHKRCHIVSTYAPVYFYKFWYMGILGDPENPKRPGAGHGEELWHMFHKTPETTNLQETDINVRYQLVTLWTNFAKTTNPTPEKDPSLDNVIWPTHSEKTGYQTLSIDTKLTIRKEVNETDLRFWEKMFKYDTAHVGWF